MARIDDLISQIADKSLRQRLEYALSDMKRRQRFGLVFEEHIPETTALLGFPVTIGSTVQRRSDPEGKQLFRVKNMNGKGRATLEPEGATSEPEQEAAKELMVVKRFGDPIFPALTPLGSVRRGPGDRPHHAVINGENFHALQLLVYLYEAQVDCIYIDPPYNTGARDWKYNNRYVDKKDQWRHSKWLSMMEKRLRLAQRLLKPDGVLICTIDEHEVNHLGMLIERVFPQYLHYMVTIVINPKGRDKANFAPVDEFAFFVVPDTGEDIILRAPNGANGGALSEQDEDAIEPASDEESENGGESEEDDDKELEDDVWEYRHARRRGGGAESSSYRAKRWNQFYPIYIDEEARTVVRAGDSIPLGKEPSRRRFGGLRPIWPIDIDGRHRCWAFIPSSMQRMIDEGNVFLGKYHEKRDDWTINYRVPKKTTRKLKTVWWEKSHDAGTHGTEMLKKLLGGQGLFPFPKSVYAVRDCLAAVVRNKPNALILDFFAGSGTTFHATCLLNAADGGTRRTVLVTNNEVEDKLVRQLQKQGIYRGDAKFEKHGIFEQVTRPRCETVVTGKRPDGKKVPGAHVDGRPFAQGFQENIEFFRIDYLDPDDVDLGSQFDAIFPSLWLAAGGIGALVKAKTPDMLVPPGAPYAVLFQEERFRKFLKTITGRTELTHVWLVTDSEDAFAEMRSALDPRLRTSMLYRDYLRNFKINTRQNL